MSITWSDNSTYQYAQGGSVYVTPQQFYSDSNTSATITINGPVTLAAPPAPARTEVERLLAEVESVCAMAR